MKHVFIILLSLSCLVSCQTNADKTTTVEETKEETVTTEGHAGDLKIYSSFADLEPRFQTNSDTVYVVNFWATWCKPCVAELPYFMDLAEAYKTEKVKFLYVSLDFKKQIDTKLKPFLEAGKLKGEVVVITDANSNEWIDKVSKEWQGSIPATLIFNKDKRNFFEQSFHYEELEAELKKYL